MTDIYEHKYKKYKYKYLHTKEGGSNSGCKRTVLSDKDTESSLNSLIKLFKGWDSKEYSGINNINKPRSTYEDLISYKTRIDTTQIRTLNNIKNLNLDTYKPDVEGITTFLKDFNFIESKKFSLTNPTFYRIEGSSGEHLITHNNIIKELNEEPKYIMEIGFNSGVSAINFLKNTKNTIVVSFDIMLHDYCWYSKMFIDNKYPNRHILIAGDSAIQVKNIAPLLAYKFDLIFIDGDHNYNSAYIDIINCKQVAHKDTIVILDNVAPHAGCGIGPYLAMNKAIEDDEVIFKKHYEIKNYSDGFAILMYKFDKDGDKSNKIDYVKIERMIPVYTLTTILSHVDQLNDKELEKLKEVVNYFEKYKLVIDDELQHVLNKYYKK